MITIERDALFKEVQTMTIELDMMMDRLGLGRIVTEFLHANAVDEYFDQGAVDTYEYEAEVPGIDEMENEIILNYIDDEYVNAKRNEYGMSSPYDAIVADIESAVSAALRTAIENLYEVDPCSSKGLEALTLGA